jgi:hypothetical protein
LSHGFSGAGMSLRITDESGTDAAVDHDRLAGDEGRLLIQEEDDQADDIVLGGEAPERSSP